ECPPFLQSICTSWSQAGCLASCCQKEPGDRFRPNHCRSKSTQRHPATASTLRLRAHGRCVMSYRCCSFRESARLSEPRNTSRLSDHEKSYRTLHAQEPEVAACLQFHPTPRPMTPG